MQVSVQVSVHVSVQVSVQKATPQTFFSCPALHFHTKVDISLIAFNINFVEHTGNSASRCFFASWRRQQYASGSVLFPHKCVIIHTFYTHNHKRVLSGGVLTQLEEL